MRLMRTIYIYWMERAFGLKSWNPFLALPLKLLSLLYVLGGYLRGLFSKPFTPANIKLISIGSPVAGGSGKTSFSIFLVRELLKRGFEVFYLQKGYYVMGKFMNRDEYLEALSLLGKERVIAVRDLRGFLMKEERRGQEKVFVLDDGFTNPWLKKTVNIAVLDSEVLTGNGEVLPLGPLRVPAEKLGEADLIVFKGKKRNDFFSYIPSIVMHLEPVALVELRSGRVYPLEFIREKEIVALCGTGNPFSFMKTLSSTGGKIIKAFIFPDHHFYSEKEIKEILKEGVVVTTQKDSMRIPPGDFPGIYVLKVEARVSPPDIEYVMRLLSAKCFST